MNEKIIGVEVSGEVYPIKDEETSGKTQTLETKTENINANLNKLNNSLTDLITYSTEEKKVGVWIDGKPIYRKVCQHSELQLVSQVDWTQLPSGQFPAGIARVISCSGCGLNGSTKPILATPDGRVLSPRNGTSQEDLFISIWEYTK